MNSGDWVLGILKIDALFPLILKTKDQRDLIIREAESKDAGLLLQYIERVSGETDNLSFGPGEFEMSVAEEAEYLERCLGVKNCIYLLAYVDQTLAGALNFSSSNRSRLIHVGEFGITVQKSFWGLGVGAMLMDALIDWARKGGIIKKINLKVRTDNHPAINLYIQKGFTVEGVMKMENYVNGVYTDLLQMGLIL